MSLKLVKNMAYGRNALQFLQHDHKGQIRKRCVGTDLYYLRRKDVFVHEADPDNYVPDRASVFSVFVETALGGSVEPRDFPDADAVATLLLQDTFCCWRYTPRRWQWGISRADVRASSFELGDKVGRSGEVVLRHNGPERAGAVVKLPNGRHMGVTVFVDRQKDGIIQGYRVGLEYTSPRTFTFLHRYFNKKTLEDAVTLMVHQHYVDGMRLFHFTPLLPARPRTHATHRDLRQHLRTEQVECSLLEECRRREARKAVLRSKGLSCCPSLPLTICPPLPLVPLWTTSHAANAPVGAELKLRTGGIALGGRSKKTCLK